MSMSIIRSCQKCKSNNIKATEDGGMMARCCVCKHIIWNLGNIKKNPKQTYHCAHNKAPYCIICENKAREKFGSEYLENYSDMRALMND